MKFPLRRAIFAFKTIFSVTIEIRKLLKHVIVIARRIGVDGAPKSSNHSANNAHKAAHGPAHSGGGSPFFWRVASGVTYAEMPFSKAIRPPLLSEWECARVSVFKNRERRSRWLAGRALAKVLAKEQLDIPGIVEIREGSEGEPLIFQDGFPRHDIWLGISVRHDRVACVIADRPVSLDVRRVENHESELVSGFVGRGEQRILRQLLGSNRAARSAAWAIKDAAQRVSRLRSSSLSKLRDVQIDRALGVQVGDTSDLDVLAIRYTGDVAVAVVGKFLLEEKRTVRVVLDADVPNSPASPPRLQAAIERSLVRARRIARARLRWQELGPQT